MLPNAAPRHPEHGHPYGVYSEQDKPAFREGYARLGGIAELRDVTWVELPTSHWPMWSRPQELAAIIGDVARTQSGA